MNCKLIQEYEKGITKYLLYKHQVSKKSHLDRKNRVKKFLEFCCKRNINEIKTIQRNDYDKFVQLYLSELSAETKRKYIMALREFFQRAKLDIRINVQKSVKSTKEKKFLKILEITGCDCLKEYKKELLEIL